MIQKSKMYHLRIEDIIDEKTNIYHLVIAAAQLSREVAGMAAEQNLKSTTKALTDLVDRYATYSYEQS